MGLCNLLHPHANARAGGCRACLLDEVCDPARLGGGGVCWLHTALEVTQGGNDGCLSQFPCKCYFEEVASVGDLRFALNSTPGWV